MILDINKVYNRIEQDIINNEKFVFNESETYSRKYSYLSDRINDVNVGLFLNDNLKPTVQIFVRNKTGYKKSLIEFNKEGNKIININEIN